MARAHDVCGSDEVVVGRLRPVRVGRSTVVLTRLPCGSLRAVSGRCPHHGAPLEFGCVTGLATSAGGSAVAATREGEVLRCPWHGFEFDLATGDPVVSAPEGSAMRLRLYDVAEKGGRVLVTP